MIFQKSGRGRIIKSEYPENAKNDIFLIALNYGSGIFSSKVDYLSLQNESLLSELREKT